MATKPKAKPEATPKVTLKTTLDSASKSASKIAPKVAQKISPAPPTKEAKAEVSAKIAPKIAKSPAPKAASKAVAIVAPKADPKTISKTVKPKIEPKAETKPKTEVMPKARPTPKSVAVQKAEVNAVEKTPPSVSQKIHKWQEIRVILEKIKEDTLCEISKSVKNGTDAVATNEPGGDIYDQASSERDRELGLLLGDREREKLHSIDEALLRIDEDEYGICEECDDDIPLGRLKAMPFTRHCVKCKSDLEKLQAQTKRFEEDRAYREIPLGSEEEES
ncbi:MAG: TraR/DksA C4-type zinc finger protein [Deltaproteobacteria bacterium]